MATKGKRVIWAGPADGVNTRPQAIEGKAIGAAILPGTVLKQLATGLDTNNIAATVFGQLFVVADLNKMMSKTVDDAWTQNENMVAVQPRSGEFVNVLVASGQNITVPGTALSRNGAGLLKVAATNGTEEIVAYADELTGGALAANTLIRVRVA
jgi:hypothetical protein